jgi:glycosyltransferase involved in cell wall biosynthesis
MRVVAVAHAYPRWDGDVAGAFIERLCTALRERDHSVTLIVPSDEGAGGKTVRNNIEIFRARYGPASRETLAYRGNMEDAARSLMGMATLTSMIASQAGFTLGAVRERQADLIHAHWWVPGGISALLASIASHRPFVITLHGTDVAILKRSNAARVLARFVMRRAATVTAVSSFLAQEAATVAGIELNDIVVQPMPLDVSHYSPPSRGGDGVVTVGRLTRQKNIPVVLEAIALLKNRGRPIALKIVGDGPERRALEYRATQLGISDLARFVGSVPPGEVPKEIGDADVFAFPAIDEGLGLAAAEAFMLGVPVIAARQGGGVRDFVPPTGAGRLVDTTDAAQMALEIEAIVGNPEARALALERGEALKNLLHPNSVAGLFEAVYRRALSRG